VRSNDYKDFFQPGRVFSTLWTVPAPAVEDNETFTSFVKYGERVHTKIRRFVVVTQKKRTCRCLPVTSYEGRGFSKPDIHSSEHGPIFSSKRPRNHPKITLKALRVQLSKGSEPLRDPSLINYGVVYIVETRVKVLDIGVLDRESIGLLNEYYRKINFPEDQDHGLQEPHLSIFRQLIRNTHMRPQDTQSLCRKS
jgi:hypothetical protein